MTAALKLDFLSPEEYLREEELSPVRHEYVGGLTYAMAGTSLAHNMIAGNLFAFLHSRLRGGPCRLFMSDVKLRLVLAEKEVFYYPDLIVSCDSRDTHKYYSQFPKLLVEILSEATEHIDRREKLLNYIQIETLEEYVLLSQDKIEATHFRRENDWRPELIAGPDGMIHLASLNLTAPLSEIYHQVK